MPGIVKRLFSVSGPLQQVFVRDHKSCLDSYPGRASVDHAINNFNLMMELFHLVVEPLLSRF